MDGGMDGRVGKKRRICLIFLFILVRGRKVEFVILKKYNVLIENLRYGKDKRLGGDCYWKENYL